MLKGLHGPVIARRRGSVYVAVLGVAMLVTLIGLSALAAVRVERATGSNTINMVKARADAGSAVELGMLIMNSTSTWRQDYPSGAWLTNKPIGDGTYTLSVVDPDGSLSNRSTTVWW